MTYEELTNRLNKVESALTALQTGSYHDLNLNIGETIQQLESVKTTLQEQLSTMNAPFSPAKEASLDKLQARLNKAAQDQINDPVRAAKAILYGIQKNVAEEEKADHTNMTDVLNAKSEHIAQRLQKALEGKFDYFGKLVDVDYAGLANTLASATYKGSAKVPLEDIGRHFEAKVDEAEVITRTNMSQDKKDVLTKAREKGVNNPEFTRKVQKSKPGDTFDLDEDHHDNPHDDSNMAKIQLLQVAEYASELLHMIEDGQELDAWIQAKITKISDYIGTVKHYLEGEEYLDASHEKGHPAEGDEEFYNGIPEQYLKLYEAWVTSQTPNNE